MEADADDTPAVRAIVGRIEGGVKRGAIEEQVKRMNSGLGDHTASQFEPGLTELGRLLGAEASKPAGQARCDSAWCWDERLWLAMEAKSEHGADGEITVKDVRQAGTQLRSLAADRGVDIPETSASVIVSPRNSVAPDAADAAEDHVHLVAPDAIRGLAADAAAAWEELLNRSPGHTGAALHNLVRQIFSGRRSLSTQVRERLTVLPVRG